MRKRGRSRETPSQFFKYCPFPGNLRRLRKERGLTQAKLGELSGGFTYMAIWMWEHARMIPNLESVCHVAKTLGVRCQTCWIECHNRNWGRICLVMEF